MYSTTENIYYSQLSSIALVLQPERNCFTSYSTRKGLCSLSPCAIALRSSPPSHVSACNGQRSSQLFCVHYTFARRVASFSDLPVTHLKILSAASLLEHTLTATSWRLHGNKELATALSIRPSFDLLHHSQARPGDR
jgi:hypothetical protein